MMVAVLSIINASVRVPIIGLLLIIHLALVMCWVESGGVEVEYGLMDEFGEAKLKFLESR
jgi:hypothetical protein